MSEVMATRDGTWAVTGVSFPGPGKAGQRFRVKAGPCLAAGVRTGRQLAQALATAGYSLADLGEVSADPVAAPGPAGSLPGLSQQNTSRHGTP